MKKCLFLVHHHDVDSFLKRIQEAGVIHVEINTSSPLANPNLTEHLQKISAVAATIKKLEALGIEGKDDTPTLAMGKQAFEVAQAIKQRREQNTQEQQRVNKDLKVMSVWGEFSFDTIQHLEEAAWITGFYSCSPKKYKQEWETTYNAFPIGKQGSALYFVTFTKENLNGIIEAETFKLADRTLSELNWKKKQLVDKQEKLNRQELELAETGLPSLHVYLQSLKEDFDFEHIQVGCNREVDDRVFLMKGFVPSKNASQIKQLLDGEAGVYYEMEDPAPTDKVPVKLRNNAFVRKFELIGGLYNLPDYKELDMTPFMAPFYLLFFGFCLQDIGYGILLFLAGILLQKKKPELKEYLNLAWMFGLSTIVFGCVVGNVFGISLAEIKAPPHWLAQIQPYFKDNNYMFYAALVFGMVQITFGMGVKVANVIKQKGFKFALAPLGWVTLIVGLLVVTGLSKTNYITPANAKIAYYAVCGVCGVMILFLNNPTKNPLANLGEGLWEVYEKSTGLMGDLMSYTRLFALGVSGAVLGFVFNELAVKMSPEFLPARILVMILILAFGHGLTIFMSCLGSFVHPVRLTFVEFYKNTGFAGTGKAYKPFSKQDKQ